MVITIKHYFTDNEDLKSELRIIKYNYDAYNFIFYSDLGVFSKDKIDFGSKLLLESFLCLNELENSKVLDVGCGYGLIGVVISKIKNVKVDMIDVNKRAIHLSEKNISENKSSAKVFLSESYANVKDKYDVIITNPPIRAGKQVLLDILLGSVNYLNRDGELWYVMHKDHGAKSMMKLLDVKFYCQVMNKDKGFYVIKAKIRD